MKFAVVVFACVLAYATAQFNNGQYVPENRQYNNGYFNRYNKYQNNQYNPYNRYQTYQNQPYKPFVTSTTYPSLFFTPTSVPSTVAPVSYVQPAAPIIPALSTSEESASVAPAASSEGSYIASSEASYVTPTEAPYAASTEVVSSETPSAAPVEIILYSSSPAPSEVPVATPTEASYVAPTEAPSAAPVVVSFVQPSAPVVSASPAPSSAPSSIFYAPTPSALPVYKPYAPVIPAAPVVSVVGSPTIKYADGYNGNAQIISYVNDANDDNSYNFAFETTNGIGFQEQGVVRVLGESSPIVASGRFYFITPEGERIETEYIADENGFQPVGNAIPTPPPIPELIQRALAYNFRNLPAQEYATVSNK